MERPATRCSPAPRSTLHTPGFALYPPRFARPASRLPLHASRSTLLAASQNHPCRSYGACSLGCNAVTINMALLTELPRFVHWLEDVAFVVQDLKFLQEGQILLAESLARMVFDLV